MVTPERRRGSLHKGVRTTGGEVVSHSFFASELRRAREESGLTQPELAKAVAYSPSLVAMVETGKRAPNEDFAQRVDDVLKTDGLLVRIRRYSLRQESVPEWFRAWPEIEQQATVLRWYEPIVIPGLLQTQAYARALTGSDDATAARLERQDTLAGVESPTLTAVVDQAVLDRQIGSPAVMVEQLQRLLALPSTVRLCVLPRSAETYVGSDGSFIIASVDGQEYLYVHTPARGFVLDSPEVVSQVRHRWETLLGESLPVGPTREILQEAEERWKAHS